MINFDNIEKYRENNRIEAKLALGGLPRSIWETYSAFANTLGGIILLGVEEHRDKSLHAIDLPDPQRLIDEFWTLVNSRKKTSINILSDNDVTVETVNGCSIIAIRVPRAHRTDKPVFIDGDVMSGTYRRGGEGDYRCTKEEVFSMMRDAHLKTQDMLVLEELTLEALDIQSISSYKSRIKNCRAGQPNNTLETKDLLCKIGGAGVSRDGAIHPTKAGLLMFGKHNEILNIYPSFSLKYNEDGKENFGNNIYDFFSFVCDKTEGYSLCDDSMKDALREALANCLTNADYHGSIGVLIEKNDNAITFSNPGGFRIDIESAKVGGISDPRNSALSKMFTYINVCKGLGGGISGIYNVWNEHGLPAPEISEGFDPERITIHLKLSSYVSQENTSRQHRESNGSKNSIYRESIILYLTDNIYATSSDLSSLLGISRQKASILMREMINDRIVTAEGNGRARRYRLKR